MERLRRLRTERGLSQAKLAARAELDPSTVNQIERGAREASPATLRKLADALDVGIADLLEDVSPKAQSRSSLEPSLLNGLEDERHPSVFAEVLINAAAQLEHREPPASLGDVARTFGMLDVIYSIAEPLIEFTDDDSTWEDRLSVDERKEIMDAGARLHRTGKRLLKSTTEYLDRQHENIENREARREAEARREQIRERTRRLSA